MNLQKWNGQRFAQGHPECPEDSGILEAKDENMFTVCAAGSCRGWDGLEGVRMVLDG